MKSRANFVCLAAALSVMAGMTQDGCQGVDIANLGRTPPAIIVENVSVDTLRRTMSVDLRAYPDAMAVTWDFGDEAVKADLSVSQGRSVTHDFPANGTYVLRVHLFSGVHPSTRERTRIASGELPITVRGPNQLPTPHLEVRDVIGVNGQARPRELEFDASGSSDPDGQIVSFVWDFGDGETLDGGAVVRHTYAASGRYVVSLEITDDRGGVESLTRSVTANIRPVAELDSTDVSNDPGASPLTFEFSAVRSSDQDGSIVGYLWDFGDGSPTESDPTIRHTFRVPGDYNVTLIVTDDLGGEGSATRLIDATGTEMFISGIGSAFGEIGAEEALVINGFNFVDGSIVRLVSPRKTEITASNVVFESDRRLIATFDLVGAAPGLRSVVVTDPAARSASLDDAYSVVTPTNVRLVTNLGDILLELDPAEAPNTVANFFQYVEDGFYDDVIFHRVVSDFVIQAGAFVSLGAGEDPRLQEKEPRDPILSEAGNGLSNLRGTIALALRGSDADSGNSQFFINLTDDNTFLDNGTPPFTVFGRVIDGMDVVDAIAAVQTGTFNATVLDSPDPSSFSDVPVDDVTIIEARRE